MVDDNSNVNFTIDDCLAAFEQNWDDSVLHKEKGLIHVLGLREIDFDSAGDFKFPSGNGDKQMRGGMPYYQPNSNWTRIGLRVRRRYDNGNDDWLKMDGNPHEWAVGFHGSTKKSTSDIAHTRPFWVRQGGFWVRQGGQAYETDKDVNSLSDKKGQPCGKGAYFAAKIDDAYKNCVIDNHACIFQVRVRPEKTRIPDGKPEYMIVNDPEYIRPYGLCLKMKNNAGSEHGDSCVLQ